MSELGTYRRVRGPSSGQGELPVATGTEAERLGLRDYWLAPDLLATTGGPHLRHLLSLALNRLATLERWAPSGRSHPCPSVSIRG